jgi:hypothetical protein
MASKFTGYGSDGFDVNGVPDSVEFVEDVPVTVAGTIEVTPRGCTTPEGIARTHQAMDNFEASAVALANAFVQFFHDHEIALIEMVTKENDNRNIREDFIELGRLVRARRAAQNEFLRAVSGQPAV